MRTTLALSVVLFALASAACGADEPLPAMPEPVAPADETSGGDLDSLDAEEEPPPAEEAE